MTRLVVALALLLTACHADGPTASRLACVDRPTDSPVASRCE